MEFPFNSNLHLEGTQFIHDILEGFNFEIQLQTILTLSE